MYSSCDVYIQYFWVTFSYLVVLVNGIKFTEDVHTDSSYFHDGLISIFVLLLHMGLDKCVWAIACCDISTSCASTTAVKSVHSILMVGHGLITSSHSIHVHCVLPFAQCWDFIVLSLFYVKSRSDSIALCLSDILSECLCTGLKHDLSCNCFISL